MKPYFKRQNFFELLYFAQRAPADWCDAPFFEMLRRIRMLHGLSQGELAILSEKNASTLSRLTTGRIKPDLALLRCLFDAMDCDLLILPRPRWNLKQNPMPQK